MVWIVLVWVTLLALWLVFAAVIDPATNLVKGVIILTVVLVPLNALRKLQDIKQYVTSALNKRMDTLLRQKVTSFIAANPDAAARVGDTVEDDDGSSLPFDTIFAVLDKSGDSSLDFQEFIGLFELLGMDIPLDLQQRMFQFADFDNSGVIEEYEFEVAWNYLKDNCNDTLVRRLGLDDGAVFGVVLKIIGFFCLSIPLFIVMIALWGNNSSFVNVIHSFFIGTVGLFAGRKKSSDAEADEQMRSAIDRMMKNLGEVAGGAGLSQSLQPANVMATVTGINPNDVVDGITDDI